MREMTRPFDVCQYTLNEFTRILTENSKASISLISQKSHVHYFDKYFAEIKVQTLLVEYNYVDRDFLEDFAGYYARCFPDYRHRCTRIHLFGNHFTDDDFRNLLLNPNDSNLNQEVLEREYLGFIVIKPLPQTVIGRTCIATYPPDGERRYFPIVRNYRVNIFGMTLSVKTLAFQEQDQVAAACATSALWTLFQRTGREFQHAIPSPVEITKKAFSNFPLAKRVLPTTIRALPNSDGLSPEMMAQAIREVGLEPNAINLNYASDPLKTQAYLLRSTLSAYLHCGIPLAMGFKIVSFKKEDGDNLEHEKYIFSELEGLHAVAVTGYSLGNSGAKPSERYFGFSLKANRIDKIYVHDDQVGPFARMEFDEFKLYESDQLINSISTSWGGGQCRAIPFLLLIPIYHKIRIPFQLIHDTVFIFDFTIIEQLRENGRLPSISQRLEWDIYLTTVNSLKSELFLNNDLSEDVREDILLTRMPRFIWRATAFNESCKVLDLFFDATDIAQGQFFVCAVEYDNQLSCILREVAKEPSLEQTFQTNPEGKILEWFRDQPSCTTSN
jgi:hypothetical protein